MGPGSGGKSRLVIQVIRRTDSRRFALLIDHTRNSARDHDRDLARHDRGLVEHDERGLVDLVEKLDRSPAAAENLIDVLGAGVCHGGFYLAVA
jgi:hypothetical protein